jgi:hypothetical protein
MAVHHITNEMVKNKLVFKQGDMWRQLRILIDDTNNNRVLRSIAP